jgi:hypothetical protein
MTNLFLICATILAMSVSGQDPGTASTPSPIQVEHQKLSSKDWRSYRGCDDTCFSLCLEKPTDFDSKCSTLFSNNTIVKSPSSDNCKSVETIQGCTSQCTCACKRCAFCKQDLVNACEDDLHPATCFENVLESILVNNKCD